MQHINWRRYTDRDIADIIFYDYFSGDNLVYFTISHNPRTNVFTFGSNKYAETGTMYYPSNASPEFILRSLKRMLEDLTVWYLIAK